MTQTGSSDSSLHPEQSNYCPACGALMYPAKLLKGLEDLPPDRPTCALHGPGGRFQHLATDRTTED